MFVENKTGHFTIDVEKTEIIKREFIAYETKDLLGKNYNFMSS